MKLLATGMTGFVGSYVLAELEKRCMLDDVIALSSGKVAGVRTVASCGYGFDESYLVESGCEEAEVLLHLGAWIPKLSVEANDVSRAASNVEGTAALLAACGRLRSLKRVVYVSTIDVYGAPESVVSEGTITNPATLYGWSKLMCEKLVSAFSAQHGLSCAILRLGHVYGEGEEVYRKVMPVMIDNAVNRKALKIIGDAGAVRSFIHVSDVARALVGAVSHEGDYVVNVAGKEPVTIGTLAEMINEFAGNDAGVIYADADEQSRDFIFDCDKLESTLLPKQIPFADGLRAEVEYMREKAKV